MFRTLTNVSQIFRTPLGLAAGLAVLLAQASIAEVPSSGHINFVAKNFIATANGTFHDWKVVELNLPEGDFAKASVVVEVDVASLDTDNERRDDHLRNPDFFEVERWPTAMARVRGVEQRSGQQFGAEFELTIRDVTKTVPGNFELKCTPPLRVTGALAIDRMDFGIGEPKTWNPMSITDVVPVTFEMELSEELSALASVYCQAP
ncbi:MAG: polyisoprenoid-binding protein YceI [Myxococcota bacterium]|jgi:polyisoprenoid-binding protein YceI